MFTFKLILHSNNYKEIIISKKKIGTMCGRKGMGWVNVGVGPYFSPSVSKSMTSILSIQTHTERSEQ